MLLQTAIEHNKNKVLTSEESCMFLTTDTTTKQRLIRCESLSKRNFSDLTVNNFEGSHHKMSEQTVKQSTGHTYFENTDFLQISPHRQKTKKEKKNVR